VKPFILSYPQAEKYNILAIGFILQVDADANMCCSGYDTSEEDHDPQGEMAYHHHWAKQDQHSTNEDNAARKKELGLKIEFVVCHVTWPAR
jgi:hypothetical protein